MGAQEDKRAKSGPDPFDVYIGQRLRLRRVQLGLSQNQVAEQIGITFQQVQKFEQAQNRISAKRLYQLAGVLDVNLDYFFESVEDHSQLRAIQPGLQSIPDLLSMPQAAELVTNFFAIHESEHRRAILELVRNMGQANKH